MQYRFLDNFDLLQLHPVFLRAFSDYVAVMNPTRDQLGEMFTRRGARNRISVAAFEADEPVGFTINAFDVYQGIPTIYDVATGIIPEARRKGIARGIFEFSMPRLRETGALRYVLEVIAKNRPAVALYQRTGFSVVRNLAAFSAAKPINSDRSSFTVKQIEPLWEVFETFWDWQPSWQNTTASMQRSMKEKILLGAFNGPELVGYGIIFPDTGDIPQFAIRPDQRRKGAGTTLMAALQTHVQAGRFARVVNVDETASPTIKFLHGIGFESFSSQHEMAMNFNT